MLPDNKPTNVPLTSLTDHIDNIQHTILDMHNKKQNMTKPLLQSLQHEIDELKNDIIKFLLPIATRERDEQKPQPTPQQSPRPAPRRTHSKPTFSEIVKQKPPHSTIIVNTTKASDTTNTLTTVSASHIINKISKHISQNNKSATIQQAVTSADKIVLKFNTNDNVEALAGELRSELGLDARGRSPLLPKLTISHIPEHVDLENNLRETIIRENPYLHEPLTQGTFDILFTYTARDFGSAVIKASPNVRSAMISNNMTLNIGRRACPVRDRLQPLRCTKCCAFGHSRKHCRATVSICTFCAKQHETSTCPNKHNTENHHCHNCSKKDETSANHPASNKDCPSLNIEIKKLIKNTNYGKGQLPMI